MCYVVSTNLDCALCCDERGVLTRSHQHLDLLLAMVGLVWVQHFHHGLNVMDAGFIEMDHIIQQ